MCELESAAGMQQLERAPGSEFSLDGDVNANGLLSSSQDGREMVATVEHSTDLGSLSSAATPTGDSQWA